jgi:hypothetical protein
MILEYPNYVSKADVAKIRSSVSPHIAAGDTHMYNRDGKTVNITRESGLAAVDKLLQKIFSSLQADLLSRRYNPVGESGDQEYEYHKYDKGQVCYYHRDGELGGDVEAGCLLRYASVILNLSTITKGGELVFPSQNRSVKSEAGKIVVFPPYGSFGHYTTPADKVREIIVTWFVYRDYIVRKVS